ncbi:hypothetical protein [Thiolapillus sp.]
MKNKITIAGLISLSLFSVGILNAANGIAVNTFQDGAAVRGENTKDDGSPVGVYGLASDTGSITSAGVEGRSMSPFGVGVRGSSPAVGVYGEGQASGSAESWGVFGRGINSDKGIGVQGEGKLFGVKGESTNGWGVYSKGNALVDGNLSVLGTIDGNLDVGTVQWRAVTSFVAVPAAAFQPAADGVLFQNDGVTLTPKSGAGNNYVAGVHLPHGATVRKMTFYWTDKSNLDGTLSLFRIDFDGTETNMAYVQTSGGGASGGGGSFVTASSFDDSINLPVVDNSQFGYYLWAYLPIDSNGDPVELHAVVIEYTIDKPY